MSREEGQRISNYKKFVPIIYLAVIAAMAVMTITNVVCKDRQNAYFGLGGYERINEAWTDAKGRPVDFDEIDEYAGNTDTYSSFYYTVPQDSGKDNSLVFRSKNTSVAVLLDGEKVYETEMTDAPFYNHSPGTRWNVVECSKESAGKQVELRVAQAYEDGRAKVDNFYWGDHGSIVLALIGNKVPGLIVSAFILFVGILLFGVSIVMYRKQKDRSLFYLAFFAVIVSVWCMIETNIFQFFSNDLRLLQMLDNCMIVIGGIPLFFYMDEVYGVFKIRGVRVLCGLNLAYVCLATISQLTEFWDYHETLNGAVLTYGIISVLLGACIYVENKRQRKGEKTVLFFRMQKLGVVFLGLGIFLDFVRYLFVDIMDRAAFMRIGMLLFLVCFGAGNTYQVLSLIRRGYRTETISKLAYQDALTKAGNRTAYTIRKCTMLQQETKEKLAIVLFDINNLKPVNDTMGHSAGDEMIRVCANMIETSFEKLGKAYRVGGDEFAVLFFSDYPMADYEDAKERFGAAIDRWNENAERPFDVSIAQGFAYCNEVNEKAFEEAKALADKRMYQNKYNLKFTTATF